MTSTKMPNPFRKARYGTRPANAVPTNEAAVAVAVKASTMGQFTCTENRYPPSPANDFIVMTSPAGEGADHARDTEQQPGSPLDAPCTGVADHRHRTGGADDEQGCGDRLTRFHAEHVGEYGDGEDRSAASEEPERNSDQCRERERDDDQVGFHVNSSE